MNIIATKNEITKKFAFVKKAAEKKKETVKHGVLVRIINEVKEKRGITVKISPSAIRQRVDRKSLQCHHLAGGLSQQYLV